MHKTGAGEARSIGAASCLVVLLALALSATGFAATAPDTPTGGPRVLAIDGLGKGTAALDGGWQFHIGDDPRWAAAGVDDATGHDGWEEVSAGQSIGVQGHPAFVGYAWYRRHLHLSPTADGPQAFGLLIPRIDDVYAVYWNGVAVGQNGGFPPNPKHLWAQAPQTFELGAARDGVLAVRIWKAPLNSFEDGLAGGFAAPPVIGGLQAIADRRTDNEYRWLHSHQYFFGQNSLYALVMGLSLLAWYRDRSQRLLLWMSLYCFAALMQLFLTGMRLPIPYNTALGWLQPVLGLSDVSLWFVLLWLLRLFDRPLLVRVTTVLAIINMTSNVLDGALTLVDWSNPHIGSWAPMADGILTVTTTLPQLWPLILIPFGFRKRLDLARWLVAIFAFSRSLLFNLSVALSQGSRYTHWNFGAKLQATLFTINGNPFTLTTIANTGLLLSIIYAVYRYMREASRRQGAVEQELRSAQELQKVLIPEALPSLPGYSVTSAYRPAQEVGGDFFQVFAAGGVAGSPAESGTGMCTLLVLGDVSGKGLRAAMTVSLIVGAIRTLAEFSPQPADVLAGLNRRLCGRLQGGFATCLVLLLHPDGTCVLANAGHPAPFLNDREIEMQGELPLGILLDTTYEEQTVKLRAGDHFVLYTDGLLEARTANGELFSFERLRGLMEHRPSAEQATQAATDFGQEDDITVLTLTRLALGEVSSTLLSAPELSVA